ncbi:uncharacterized protein LOC125829040 [Solanum verrucosum]|uniref:uncharacterized protein LOC125829040 n=1 Tax=Solanum verrucosum TaxID=315347 RepID=UPI0020D127BB|nr:uncharacterized protein LOC125829040 [Solanum verrucosum]
MSKFVERAIDNALLLFRGHMVQFHNTLATYGESLDNLTARMYTREKREGTAIELIVIRGEITTLRDDVDKLRSIDISMLWGEFPLLDVPEVVPPSESRVDAPRGVAEKSDDGTDEVGDEDEDEFLPEDEQQTVETLTEL